ncbi:23S rRNA (uracil(1939)-C(5))-methyltransferase [Erwinia sp. OLTSP20]|uniref:23S rRNA (uracil(1939)-C(5))-methyltransferase RlmD n=1 Tax=unclassified Erwinia TaxID=2622719 RepID=UPI000C175536|nr:MULTISPECIES: 23S rRNA (uracil(1939)-C(5))-methyltransferase RlmD [unclassified Erwinia]PIJ49062.1 23S rRNA (uracil(1939)-C(5))-methyltransferase [Erwinia sp. OAMSP11]PIJ75056.1 23S rRNA (uracil(1939)-C(5))-methyltransferase [Erwinia sp. OLSSP12]PIJ79747.1 23S rRNA (uracil(1939)-C(5))-methyltransferase [Erwinia sp. OLCASP19]PIJ80532.1 23S rRNA (uracil(1939)-C(5))-methyltransferase [Erwinia sp. OLMTSP26]PIJ82646.1 23S rRNA (uracil(1939)-C(5))-methyltransferase [Erwinia sp. OLMDSP33]
MAQFYSAKRRVTTAESLVVTVSDLSPQGQGIARHKGKAIFIAQALPGEEVEITLTEEKKQFARGRLTHIRVASDQRQTPRCRYFTTCGGCQQQHASEALQQQSKASALSHLLWRETGITPPRPSILAGERWQYRRRARLGLQFNHRQRQLVMGFRQENSHQLVAIDHCPVLRPELDALLLPLQQCLSALQAVSRLGHVELVLADNGPLLVLRHLDRLTDGDRHKLERFSQEHQIAVWLAPDSTTLEMLNGDWPWYQLDGLRLTFSPRDFIQVNGALNQRMVAQALHWLDVQPQDRVLDLFCGMGNFSLPLAKRVQSVTGVEGVTALVEKAAYNAVQNNLSNASFFVHNLEEPVVNQPWAAQGFNKVLLDPARAGAAGVMGHVAQLRPSHVVYVSCNPTTLARDSQALLSGGYQLEKIAMLDMFPHTAHLESMALFRRK